MAEQRTLNPRVRGSSPRASTQRAGRSGLLLALVFSAAGPPAADAASPGTNLTASIHAAAAYLIRACGPDGQFVYRVNTNPAFTPRPRYNVLRHAGAVYALAQYQQAYPSPSCLAAIERAAGFMKDKCLGPVPKEDGLLAIWSDPAVNLSTSRPRQAKLGGAGLGLVALASAERVRTGLTELSTLRGLGRFVLYMQKPDGSFYSKYFPGVKPDGRDDSWTSLYYPGEAALGLLMLHELDPQPEWLAGAAQAISYLADSRRSRRTVPPDHWALLATAHLLERHPRGAAPLGREEAVAHAARIARKLMDSAVREGPLRGCLVPDGRTCPTATRLEGLLAADGFLAREHAALAESMQPLLDPAIAFLRRCQLTEGPHAGGIPRAAATLPADHPGFGGSFNRRATEIRIDYVQHALSAMLQYRARGARKARP